MLNHSHANKLQDKASKFNLNLPFHTVRSMEKKMMLLHGDINQESDYEGQTVKAEANGNGKSDTSPVKKRRTNSKPLSSPKEDNLMYCAKCHLKYDGGCPKHGPPIYIDNVQAGQREGCSQDSSSQIHVTGKKNRKGPRRKKVQQLHVSEAHNDDAETLPNGDCSIELGQMFSGCEMNSEVCVAGTSCTLHCNVEIEAQQKVHDTTKPFTCDLCGVAFAKSITLVTHVRSHTGEKPFRCDVCGASFSENGNLKSHKRTHTGEKPFKCDVCETGFSQQSNLKAHKRTHTAEKPYKCEVCGIGFSQHGNLKVHRRTHTGEKPYKCDVCGVGFTRSGHLKRHKVIHTGRT